MVETSDYIGTALGPSAGLTCGKTVRKYGGEGGIRTPDTRQGMAAFEAARFNHSRTSPREKNVVEFMIADPLRESLS